MIVSANWKKLKNIFEIHRRQKENHLQEKEIKIQKNLWKVYNSNSVILTFRSLSEITKSQIEEDFQSFELDSEEQFKKNNTNC
jgi:uncharacterized protein YnzC (UPF0291/DUF896 family)